MFVERFKSLSAPIYLLTNLGSLFQPRRVGVKDARLLLWVAEGVGVPVSWPFVVYCDSKQAISFQEDTCPKSRNRGSFDLRGDWVAEVRD